MNMNRYKVCGVLLRTMALLAVVSSTAGCGGKTPILITLTGISSEVRSVDVLVSLDGERATPLLLPALEQFVLYVPEGLSGHLDIAVRAVDSGDCSISQGASQIDFMASAREPVEITIALVPFSMPICTLLVLSEGGLSPIVAGHDMPVVDEPLDCDAGGVCRAKFFKGINLRLSTSTTDPRQDVQWTGDCLATGNHCALTLDRSSQVVVRGAARRCSSAGWCIYNPIAVGSTLRSIWGSSAKDIWAVGDAGAQVHWDGLEWVLVERVTTEDLTAIWGSGKQDIWAVGDHGTFIHFDGVKWSQAASKSCAERPKFKSIWGSGAKDIWVVDDAQTVWHWDGTDWVCWAGGLGQIVHSLWGTGPEDIWGAASQSTVLHSNGKGWLTQRLPLGTSENLYGVWGTSNFGPILVGDRGLIYQHIQTEWQQVDGGVTSNLRAIWGRDSKDIWVVGDNGTVLHTDGMSWSQAAPPTTLNLFSVWGIASDVWAVGQEGTILRFLP